MATIAGRFSGRESRPDVLSGTPRAHAVDRWIYVFMAAMLIVVTLAGFIPDSIMKVDAIKAGTRPPFPIVLHFHAVLMGSFLLLLLAQTTLVATGRCDKHMVLGRVAMVLVPALVLAGVILVPTIYHGAWNAGQAAPPEEFQALVHRLDNIMLLQLRFGLLFPLFIFIGLRARGVEPGLHKRMMILATIVPMPASINRIAWLPTTFPASPVGLDLYLLALAAPMFLWDVFRNRSVHRAYWIWLGVNAVVAVPLYSAWGSDWWYATAPKLMGL